MTPSVDSVLSAALSLPPDDRATLAERLLESLDGKDRAEIEAAWVEEAEARLRAYDEGLIKAIPGDEVMRSLSSRRKS